MAFRGPNPRMEGVMAHVASFEAASKMHLMYRVRGAPIGMQLDALNDCLHQMRLAEDELLAVIAVTRGRRDAERDRVDSKPKM